MHKMKRAGLLLWLAGIFAGAVFSHLAEARDLSVLQSGVTYARDDMEKAQAAHEANIQEVARQQKIVEEHKKQLDEENKRLGKAKNNTVASQKFYLDAKKKYEKAQSLLDDAWGKR
ncbi:MAG: hypothetical protein PHP70_01140 [Gallionella sp.]|nr:hypothetical protein [Gallionella sp.]